MTAYASTTFASSGSRVTDVVHFLLERGVRRIELGSIHAHEEGVEDSLRGLGAAYLVHNYFPPPPEPFVVNLASADRAIRARSLEHALASVAFTARLGAGAYTFHPGFLGDPTSASGWSGSYDFVFGPEAPAVAGYRAAFDRFVDAARQIAVRAETLGVRVAVESEGSVARRNRLLLQRPEEFDALFEAVPSAALGVNVNLGHLNLAARAFGFDRMAFIERVAHRIVAFELSHNGGLEDEHRPPVPDTWYWAVVRDPRFAACPVIVECRGTPVDVVVQAVSAVEAAQPTATGRPA